MSARAAAEQGTVDLVSADDPRLGAFSRVVPSAYVFTLHFPDDADEAVVAAQMATVEEELETVRQRVE